MFEDKRLLSELRAGDKDALRRIYEKYIDDMLRVAVSLLSDIQAAEDCLHDVFVDFAGTVNGSMIHSNLKSYLISCVANRARDHLRSKARQSNIQPEQLCSRSVLTSPARAPWAGRFIGLPFNPKAPSRRVTDANMAPPFSAEAIMSGARCLVSVKAFFKS